MPNFEQMTLSLELKKSLTRLKFIEPTPIQAQTIPIAIEGHDIIGSAQTGTGKTLAFAIPTIEKIIANPELAAIILTPTRELAQQVAAVMKQIVAGMNNFRIALLIGGEPIGKQFPQLKVKPNIIIGTPGRVIDHMKRSTLKLHNVSLCVLDETDRMLDMGFSPQIEEIIAKISDKRQTLMFSATFPAEITKLATKYLKNPQRITVGNEISIVSQLKEETITIDESKKFDTLKKELELRQGSIIIFVGTKIKADELASMLGKQARSIHGEHRQSKRESTIRAFRSGKVRVLVATDVAARGLDIAGVEHVINYDLPILPEDYLHRVGRTARGGASGSALSFIAPREQRKWRAIQQYMNPDMKFEDSPVRRKSRTAPSKSRNSKFSIRTKRQDTAPFKKSSKKKPFEFVIKATGPDEDAKNYSKPAKRFAAGKKQPSFLKKKNKDNDKRPAKNGFKAVQGKKIKRKSSNKST